MLMGVREQPARAAHAADQHHPRPCRGVRPGGAPRGWTRSSRCWRGSPRTRACRRWRGRCSPTLGEEYRRAGTRASPSIDKQAAGLPARQRAEPAPDGDPDDRPDRRLPAGHQDRSIRTPSAPAARCAAWLGLTPKDHSTAGKQRLGGITRAGDESLRAALVRRRHRLYPASQARPHLALALARRLLEAQAAQAGRRGAGQQDRAHRLEADDQRRALRSGASGRPARGSALRNMAGSAPSPSLHPLQPATPRHGRLRSSA